MSFNAAAAATGFANSLGPSSAIACPAGGTILVFVQGNGGPATSVNDGAAYTQVGTTVNSSFSVWKRTGVAAGSYTPVANAGTNNIVDIVAASYSNGDVTGTPQILDASFAGTGNNVLSENVTPAADGALLVGFCINTSGGVTYTAGTIPNGFTARTITGYATSLGLLEDFQLGAGTGGNAQTITMGNAGSSSVNSGQLIAFLALAAAAASGPPRGLLLGVG